MISYLQFEVLLREASFEAVQITVLPGQVIDGHLQLLHLVLQSLPLALGVSLRQETHIGQQWNYDVHR